MYMLPPIKVDHLLLRHRLEAPGGRPQHNVLEGINLYQKALLNVVVEASDGKARVIVILPDPLGVLGVLIRMSQVTLRVLECNTSGYWASM